MTGRIDTAPHATATQNGPVRDQHGHPLPGTGDEPGALGPDQVDDALAALPGRRRQGATLDRGSAR